MKKQRRHYTPQEKVAILRRHLLEKLVANVEITRLSSWGAKRAC